MKTPIAYFNIARAFVWGAPWRKYLTCGLLGVAATLLAQCAFATEIQPFPKPINPDAVAVANAGANAEAAADANAKATASSGGNTLSVTEARQAPSLAQGGLYLAGCGFSGNVGDSDSHGASFLGIQFITPGCWDQMAIQNEARMGNIKTACEMNRLTRQGQRNIRRLREAGMEPEPCPSSIAPPPVAPDPKPTVVVLAGESCASNERTERILEKCVGK